MGEHRLPERGILSRAELARQRGGGCRQRERNLERLRGEHVRRARRLRGALKDARGASVAVEKQQEGAAAVRGLDGGRRGG
eukprot:6191330-Prymnesium_polylepis.1